ncbi:MAG: GumC family protein [Deltaproteobacteria bacterium]
MQYELNLQDYLRIFLKRKLLIAGSFAVIFLTTFENVSKQPYIYEASSSIKIEERKSIAGLLTEWIVYNPEDIMESETKIIRGFPVMDGVARQLGLITPATAPDEANRIVADLQRQVETKKVENTNIIRINVRNTDARRAMDVANAAAQVYIQQNLLEKTKQARAAREFISDQLKELEGRLAVAEDKLREFGDRADQIRLAEPIQKKIMDLQFELSALLQKYTEKHPKIIQMRQQIKELESQIGDFSTDELEYGRIQREVEANKKLYGILKEKLEEARITEAQKVSDISIVDPAVLSTAPVEPNKVMVLLIGAVLGLVVGVALAFFFETIDPSMGTIEDVENILKLPVLGVVPSIKAEIADEAQRGFLQTIKDVIHPITARTQQKREMNLYVRLFVHHKPNSVAAESFRNIQANLKINPDYKKVFLVTSAGPAEGKTTILINLGLICAQSGLRTLLISADLRRPAVARAFGLKRENGLREYLEGLLDYRGLIKGVSDMALGDLGLDEVLKFPGIENTFIITSGDIPSNPAAVLTSKRFQDLLEQAKKDFDLILIDSPPVLPIADASIIAPLVDNVLLVYEIGKTARQALMRAKVQVEATGGRITGVILNNIRSQIEYTMLTYPYYYKYKYRYKKEKPEDQEA